MSYKRFLKDLRECEIFAAQGNIDAQFALGLRYESGIDVIQGATRAIFWYQKGAEQGDSRSQVNLGLMYSRGSGVKQDYTQALHWYSKSAKAGNEHGQYYLGVAYANGHGVSVDEKEAYICFRLAALHGSEQAIETLYHSPKEEEFRVMEGYPRSMQNQLIGHFRTLINKSFHNQEFMAELFKDSSLLDNMPLSEFEKLQTSTICMALYLSYRGALESFLTEHNNKFKSTELMESYMVDVYELFESIVYAEKKSIVLPTYVDDEYFYRWRRRYESSVLEEKDAFKVAVLTAYLSQVTFEYEEEPKVNMSAPELAFLGGAIYDEYVVAFRDYLGEQVLSLDKKVLS
jgi:hypothetical protein